MWNQGWLRRMAEALSREMTWSEAWMRRDSLAKTQGESLPGQKERVKQRPWAEKELGRFKGWKKAGDAKGVRECWYMGGQRVYKGHVLKDFAYHIVADWSVVSPPRPLCTHLSSDQVLTIPHPWHLSDPPCFITIFTATSILTPGLHPVFANGPPWLASLQLSSTMPSAWELEFIPLLKSLP